MNELEPGELNNKGERIGANGKVVVFPDGKSTSFDRYIKRMRTEHPDIEVGDKLPPAKARKLFKHDISVQKKIKGSRLELIEKSLMGNGMTRYKLKNKKIEIMWAEGPSLRKSKKKKLRGRHYITRPQVKT